MKAASAAVLLAVLLPAQAESFQLVQPVLDGQLNPAWREMGLPQQRPPATRFAAARVDGREALLMDANASYGTLVLDLSGRSAPATLAWSWRLEQPNTQVNPQVNLATKAGDDAAAKLCLSFEVPLAQVPFVERQVLRLARARTGQELPAATLCWAWGGPEAVEALVPNPYTRRVRTIVLRNREHAAGAWFEETRDVASDFRRAFGEESAVLPPLGALIVAADADNTGAHSRAYVTGLRFGP